ncbi:MAG: DNA gyrase subunit A [Candidatus Syntrophoarchaeum caldarius]|uniref:DNA gyrase subunit A n=1 Tax=Candidatus Syntropharchaeum caldarium TaxID=1838285 RepID=A0A1F2PAJ1_9EURY|nr:MAG: DNA gyrase subunit A [Candidatus Syntrophoarchaeum caldarius]
MVVSERVIPVSIEDEMKRSYIDYAMSVIIGRALPDVRDGLKPVHRRILYAMYDMGLTSDKPYRKTARIVGDVLGKYHPHGDIAVYDALVRMVQDFSLRYPLIDGQGNFGSVDGDSAAAMRYTEARLAKIAELMLVDIKKETVDFTPNFDETLQEPVVLPAMLPNLLINGSSGIAVGMATNMPPHNLSEVVDGILMVLENPEVTTTEIMKAIPAPDFPTGGIIMGVEGVRNAYETGRGSIKIRAKAAIENGGKYAKIIVSEIPYQVNKSRLIEKIAGLTRDKTIEGIRDLRDESDKNGMRIMIELKSGVNPNIVLNQLYKHTEMEVGYGIINLAIVDGVPEVLGLKQIISHYIAHRREIIRRRTEFDLKKARNRFHIVEGLLIALSDIDRVIKIIKSSENAERARVTLQDLLKLSEIQAKEILNMRLQRLTALEQQKLEDEHKELTKQIEHLEGILADETKITAIIGDELRELKTNYGDERRTEIIHTSGEIEIEDLIADEPMIIAITHAGYIKRMPTDTFRSQGRGGKGVIGMETKEEDFVEDIFSASMRDFLLYFTNRGRVFRLKVYEIPAGTRQTRGKPIINLLNLDQGERVVAISRIADFDEEHYLFFATKSGMVKKTVASAFENVTKAGKIAIGLKTGDEVVGVKSTDGSSEIILGSRFGKAVRFSESDVRPMGRTARGVRGIRLDEGDSVISMVIVNEDETLLTVTTNGYGKRTKFEEYPLHRRGGKGVINIITTRRNGLVAGIIAVKDDDEIMITTQKGLVIRQRVDNIRVIGRNTQGVRIMRLGNGDGDQVVGVARIVD